MSTQIVRIVVEAAHSSTGRLTGSVISANGDSVTFSGTLELLACIETAIDAGRPSHPPTT